MNLKIFNSYVIKNLCIATAFVAITLAAIILMTQSLKFLELIINSGASSRAFWALAFLALPWFFEVILPIALMISGLFVYNRMISDSEVIVMRAAGISPLQMARPALVLGAIITIIVMFITSWLAPVSLSKMQKMRSVVKAQYSTLLFQEAVFNEAGKDITVYINNRNLKGELEGVLIHDSRPENPVPVTIIAKRGIVVATDKGQQVLVYNGSRQELNKKTGVLNRLDFERYSIDLPDAQAVSSRWKEPDERTFIELFNPDTTNADDVKYKKEFIVEANRRLASSLLPMTFISVVLSFLLLGQMNRRGQSYRILWAVSSIIILQSLFLSMSDLALKNILGIIAMYIISIIPFAASLFLMSSWGENFRQNIFFKRKTLKKGMA